MNFYVGQEVVCIKGGTLNNNAGETITLIEGRTYKIEGLKKGCTCAPSWVNVGFTHKYFPYYKCSNCGFKYRDDGYWWINESRFAPIESIPASHEIAVKKLIEESQTILN